LPTLKVVVWRLIVEASESNTCPSSVVVFVSSFALDLDAVALSSESELLRVDSSSILPTLLPLLLTSVVVAPSVTPVTEAITPFASAEPSFLIRILKSFGEPAIRF